MPKSDLTGGGGAPSGRPPVERLSGPEFEVFRLLGGALTADQVAESMRVSLEEVEASRARIKDKLGLGSNTELIRHATQWVLDNRSQSCG
jgi:DNA-binding CsgD family transcriptional regulator